MKRLVIAAMVLLFSASLISPANADEERGHRDYPPNNYREHSHHGYYPSEWEHKYHYEGHWRSWRDWDDYRREHPDRYRDGRYYHENGHLFFRWCDASANCFAFSVGG